MCPDWAHATTLLCILVLLAAPGTPASHVGNRIDLSYACDGSLQCSPVITRAARNKSESCCLDLRALRSNSKAYGAYVSHEDAPDGWVVRVGTLRESTMLVEGKEDAPTLAHSHRLCTRQPVLPPVSQLLPYPEQAVFVQCQQWYA